MALRNAVPLKFKPRGVADTYNGMNSVPGAMSSLANLVSDTSTPYCFQCRPAVVQALDITTNIASAGFVSGAFEINGRVYGLVASSTNTGKDQPFSYNIMTSSFDTISGVTSSNVPLSPSSTGDWTPPTFAVLGPYIVVTHPGFSGATNGYFGWFDTTNPLAPVWHSGNTATNGLTGVPTNVELFYNRLYFTVGNTMQYTDTLALTRTNASQSLTAGDTSPIVALSLFTLTTTTQGILQGLLAFKNNTVFQVTGDAALSNLAINSLNTAAGTNSPASVVPTPNGVFFVAPDGVRIVQADGTVSEPDQDIRLPFINAVYKSRISAAYNSDVYRICVQNGGKNGSPWEEYWFDMAKEIWTGPHSFQQDIALPYGVGFLLFTHLYPAKMYTSNVVPLSSDTYVELGTQLTWTYQTSPAGEEDSMMVNNTNAMLIDLSFVYGSPALTCTVADVDRGVVATAVVNPPSTVGAAVWGSFIWGSGVWGTAVSGLRPHLIPWTNPVTFTKMQFTAMAPSSANFKISTLKMMNQPGMYFPPV